MRQPQRSQAPTSQRFTMPPLQEWQSASPQVRAAWTNELERHRVAARYQKKATPGKSHLTRPDTTSLATSLN